MSLSLTVVMMTSVLLVLSLGIFDFTFGSHLRRVSFFREGEGNTNWNSSLHECKNNDSSLVTLYDQEDVAALLKIVSGSVFWSGLRKNESSVTTWSDGSSLAFNISQVTNIGDDQICEAMTNRTWKAFNCSDRKPFMCYKDKNYILIKEEKDWCQALQYCRRHYTDLVSISNETQNNEVSEKGKNETFWIGLQHDQWTWADGSCSTYRNWTQYRGDPECAKFDLDNLYKVKCDQHYNPLCTKGNMRIKVIKTKLTWEEALNYCERNHSGLLWIEDEEDQKAVEQWLNYTNVEGPFWIGLRQSTLFGFWIWKDRTVGYNNWKNGKIPAMPMSNHCGVIVKTNATGKWIDEDCWREHHVLCEEEIVLMNKKSSIFTDRLD